MPAKKLLELVKSLTEDEFKQLRRFLRSDYYNTDDNLSKLYVALARYAPHFDSAKMTNETLFKRVFPKADWDYAKWRNLAAKLTKVLENYLVVLELNELTHRRLLAQALDKRNLYTYFVAEQQSLIDELTAQTWQDAENLRKSMLLKKELFFHPMTDPLQKAPMLNDLQQSLELFYELEKIRLACDSLVLQRIQTSEQHRSPGLPGVEKEPVLLKLYHLVQGVLSDGTEADFHVASQFLTENMASLGKEDQKFALLHLQNFAIGQATKGKEHFNSFLFDLYRLGLDHQILLENGQLTKQTFLNIVSTGGWLQAFDWVEQFIETHEQYLHPDIRHVVKTRSIADLYFRKGEHEKVTDILADFEPDDLMDLYISKSLAVRSYFEIYLKDDSYFKFFNAYAARTVKQIGRKGRLPKTRRESFAKFVKTLRRIVKLKYESKWTAEVKETYLQDIKKEPNILVKAWLLQKIETM